MPRSNDKPFSCWQNYNSGKPNCRFLQRCWPDSEMWVCMRNPKWIEPSALHGCFAGEPIVGKSCNNCALLEREDKCPMNTVDAIFCDESYQKLWKKLVERGWYCSDWRVVE